MNKENREERCYICHSERYIEDPEYCIDHPCPNREKYIETGEGCCEDLRAKKLELIKDLQYRLLLRTKKELELIECYLAHCENKDVEREI